MLCYKCTTPIPDNSRFCLSCGSDVSGASGERTQPVVIDHELEHKLREELGAGFVLEHELGRGGMAAVFLATEIDLGRKVAIKVLPPELTFGGGMMERFKREARTAATLDHPNIIPIYRVSSGGKLLWYAMKYLEGEALSTVLERERQLDLARAWSILHQVADALDYAHEHGVIHRDIKPANVMLDARQRVTVTDFGIAKALQNASMTGSGSMIGTPYYMSPEQCSGKQIAGSSDQYSLGVVTYQMLSGHLPFKGDSVFDIVKQHCMDPPPPLGVLRPELPPAVVAVVERALAKAPDDRFPSASAFAHAFATSAGIAAAPHGGTQSAFVSAAAPGQARRKSITYDVARPRMPHRRPVLSGLEAMQGPSRTPWIVTGVVVAVITLGGGGVLLVRSGVLGGSGAGGDTTSVTVPPVSPSPDAAGPSPPAATTTARVSLANLPEGATIRRNGRDVTGRAWSLPAGRRYAFEVVAPGYQAWNGEVTPSAGSSVSLTVQAVRTAPTGRAAGTEQAAQPAPPQPPSGAGQVQPQGAQPAQSAPGVLVVESRPNVHYTVNGVEYINNPGRVPYLQPGNVTVVFEETDSTRSYSAVVTITAGGTTRLTGVVLPRKR